jgi:hypothetical protein
LRRLINLEETRLNMIASDRVIDEPAYHYVNNETMMKEVEEWVRREKETTGAGAVGIRYRTKHQIEEEKEELEIAGQIDAAKDLHDLSTLLNEGKVKKFYALANKVMRIKRSNPVVTKVKRVNDKGDVEVFEEKVHVEKAISDYFTEIYKRPDQMAPGREDEGEDEEMINTVSAFTVEDVAIAARYSNFNKGLGPDCFDGNMLKQDVEFNDKILTEITGALNDMRIPEYLRVGRLVPL